MSPEILEIKQTLEMKQTLDALRVCRAELMGLAEVVREHNPDLVSGETMRRIVFAQQFAEYVLAKNAQQEKAA
jgi:hypothetical protein